MTNDLKTKIAEAAIEPMARAISCVIQRERGIDPFGSVPRLGGLQNIDIAWSGCESHARDALEAALQAIHDAGFAVVPREPTEAMAEFGNVAMMGLPGSAQGRREAAAAYRAMIQASQPKTEKT